MISNAKVVRLGADEAGVAPLKRTIPVPALYAMGAAGSLMARLSGTDQQLTLQSVRLMRVEADVDCAKARSELHWEPRPVQESVREAARFWAEMRAERKKTKAAQQD